jgi:hypothetical protein
MVAIPTFFFALGACLSLIPTTLAVGQVQKPNLVVPTEFTSQKDVVKGMFRESYDVYRYELQFFTLTLNPHFRTCDRKYAFKQDNVKPLSKGKSPPC